MNFTAEKWETKNYHLNGLLPESVAEENLEEKITEHPKPQPTPGRWFWRTGWKSRVGVAELFLIRCDVAGQQFSPLSKPSLSIMWLLSQCPNLTRKISSEIR
jgi:hypothetical protein